MTFSLKRKAGFAAAGLAAIAFAGGAYAAVQDPADNVTNNAFLTDVAKRLHVSPQQLKSALQGAFFDRLDAAVAAGRLTKAQADQIKQRVLRDGILPFEAPRLFGERRAGALPFFGPMVRAFGPFAAAAKYLGLSDSQLMTQLASGKSLAQIASARGKSVAGLKQAITSTVKARLDRQVAAKLLTSAQEQQLLSRLNAKLDGLINRTLPRPPLGMLPRLPWHGAGGIPGPPGPPPRGAFGPAGPGTPY